MEIYKYLVQRPSGKLLPYYVLEKRFSSIVIPVTHDLHTYLIGQYRFAAKKASWEFPGGEVATQDPKDAAKKELEEETGLIAEKLVPLGKFFINAGYSNQECYVYSAYGLVQKIPQPEATEFLEVKKVSFEEFENMIKIGAVIDSPTIAAYFLYKSHQTILLKLS